MAVKKLFAAAGIAVCICTPVAAFAATAFTTTTVNMRSGPDTAYPPVGVLPPSQPVEVLGCIDGWVWCDVVWGGYRGWIAGAYLQAADGAYRTEFVPSAPRLGVPIVHFRFGDYWDRHYRGRPFYRHRGHWERWDRARPWRHRH